LYISKDHDAKKSTTVRFAIHNLSDKVTSQ